MNSIYSAVSGIKAFSTGQEVIANNLANSLSTGFKSKSVNYAEVAKGGEGLGVRLAGTATNSSQGAIARTDRTGDHAIIGDGFFKIETPGGDVAYTRNGSFTKDSAGNVRSSDGDYLLGNGGRIQVPAQTLSGSNVQDFEISQEGKVFALGADGSADELDTLSLSTFNQPGALEPLVNGRFRETTASGTASESAPNELGSRIQSGALELSNVDFAGEITQMILFQRAFEANVKTVQVGDELLQTLNNLKR